MHWGPKKSGRLSVLLLVTAVVLSACGSNKEETNEGSGQDGGAPADQTVKIGVIAPLSGSLAPLGVGIKNAAELAVKEANEKRLVKGWKIVLDAQDDAANPDTGGAVANKLASDGAVAGVIGTLNSSVAQQVQKPLNDAGIVVVSPANTNPSLTQGLDPANKKRPFATYFRVATTDAIQGPFAADFAYDTGGFKNAVVIHDKKTYGQGLALAFKERFEAKGGKVSTVETIEPNDEDFSTVLSKVKRFNPDLIYYGGEFPAASLITDQADLAKIKAPLMGGDGIFDKTYIDVAKQAGEGDLATSVGAPTAQLASAKAFVDAYKAAGYSDDHSAYGAYSYDATNVIIQALAKVLPDKKALDAKTRQDIVAAVQATDLDGATGKVSFDEYGDTTTKILTVYKVEAGAWKPQKTAEFK